MYRVRENWKRIWNQKKTISINLCQSFLPLTIKSVCGEDLSQKTFCDIFAGTGIVGRTFKTSVKKVISNDIEYYSYVLNKNYIENHRDIPNI